MQNAHVLSPSRAELSRAFRRVPEALHGASERAGELLGSVAAPAFALTSLLRRARTFHPRGDCADAELTVADGAPLELVPLASLLCGRAFVRFSDALTKGKARWPDVLGCALRIGGEDPACDGDQDLLFATIRRPWTMGLSPLTTHVEDYLANDYFAVSPFSAPTLPVSRVWLRLHPIVKETAATIARRGFSPSDRAARRRGRLELAIATGDARLVLGVATSPWGPFAPLVDVQLESIRLHDPPDLHFDPFRAGRGIEPRGFVQALRRSVYGASRLGRAVVDQGAGAVPLSPLTGRRRR
jgi:hypothetical protein